MPAAGQGAVLAFGFLTVAELTQGACGGYLVLNAAGRPLEFHCTAPVRANRAQEILYGPTLRPFLYGEQIAPALVAKAKLPVAAVFCDLDAILALRGTVESPVVCVLTDAPSAAAAADAATRVWRSDEEHAATPAPHAAKLVSFECHSRRLAVPGAFAGDRAAVEAACGKLAPDFDLSEPFERIREAIQETQSGGKG